MNRRRQFSLRSLLKLQLIVCLWFGFVPEIWWQKAEPQGVFARLRYGWPAPYVGAYRYQHISVRPGPRRGLILKRGPIIIGGFDDGYRCNWLIQDGHVYLYGQRPAIGR